MVTAKDLTKEAPRSLCQRVKGYAVLARMADKGRATINGTMGEYHFNCPLEPEFLTASIEEIYSVRHREIATAKELLKEGYTVQQLGDALRDRPVKEKSELWVSGSIRDLLGAPKFPSDRSIARNTWSSSGLDRNAKAPPSSASARDCNSVKKGALKSD